uniref:pleckstrin homology domain-containing family D member 1-like n=1 Tax=Fragaria vesca subsp. vesca TaxID=101020 RepID=UPI0005CAF48A|nr:PREDICTED: pleckstrin homology domain-containing family D member 1-like [Fragaria vesca subsp. vesca]
MMVLPPRRKEFENKEKVLKEVEGRIRLKERELDAVLKLIQEQTIECDVKGKQVMALQMSIEKCEKEMELKWEEWSCKLELKERELERLFEKFELRGKQFEPIVEEIRVIDKRVDECLNEGLIKERYLQSSEKSIQERERALDSVSHDLEMKGRHIEEEAKQLELKQTQFSCQVKTQLFEREKYFASSLKKLLEQQDQSLNALQMKMEAVKKLSEGKHEQQGRAILELKPKLFDSQLLGREVQLVLLRKLMEEFEKQY